MGSQWWYGEVQAFLCFVADEKIQRELDGATHNEKMFREISELMASHVYKRTLKQCRESDYCKIKDHNGWDWRNWKWLDLMESIYGNRPANNGRASELDTATSLLESIIEDGECFLNFKDIFSYSSCRFWTYFEQKRLTLIGQHQCYAI